MACEPDVYTDAAIDTYSPDWDAADLTDFDIDGDNILLYTNVTYAAIVFETATINASSMDYLHVDVWVPASVSLIGVKLIDYGADGEFGGGDDSEKELYMHPGSVPALTPGSWSSLDIPLADFMVPGGLQARATLAQLYLTGSNITIFADNIYFFRTPPSVDEGGAE